MRSIPVCTFAAAMAVVCAMPAVAQDSVTLKRIAEKKTIVLGVREGSNPFSYLDAKQQYIGYSIDLCMKIVDAVKADLKMPNLKVSLQPVTSSNRIQIGRAHV